MEELIKDCSTTKREVEDVMMAQLGKLMKEERRLDNLNFEENVKTKESTTDNSSGGACWETKARDKALYDNMAAIANRGRGREERDRK